MAEVGPGGLLASDFLLSQRLARVSVQQVGAHLSLLPQRAASLLTSGIVMEVPKFL